MATFTKESDFESAIITELTRRGWEDKVLKNPTEQDLLNNWAAILFENNRGIDRLNDVPLTDGEMQQIMERIHELRTPLKLNGLINGKTVLIKRDNPADALHFGKEVSLKIYDRHEIAAGQSRYQIVQQPQFKRVHELARDRRGDLMLLINGMPVFHLELKRSGVPVSQAYNQIQTYSREGVFSGLFSLVQILLARLFIKKTANAAAPPAMCLAMSCTAIASLMASAIKTCWVLTLTAWLLLKTVMCANLLRLSKPKRAV